MVLRYENLLKFQGQDFFKLILISIFCEKINLPACFKPQKAM